MTTDIQIVRLPKVREITGNLSASTIYRLEKAGDFPQRVRLGKNSVGWNLAAVAEWAKNRQPVITKQEHNTTDRG